MDYFCSASGAAFFLWACWLCCPCFLPPFLCLPDFAAGAESTAGEEVAAGVVEVVSAKADVVIRPRMR